MQTSSRLIGAILMVVGTTVGGAMLALPVSTGLIGFYPTSLLFFFYWILMTFSAFLFLEVNLWSEENINLVSMAKMTLGKAGELFTWIFYLFLLYALTTAYLAVSGPFFLGSFRSLFGFEPPSWTAPFPLILLFGFFVYRGAHAVDLVNRWMMGGFALFYALLTVWLSMRVDPGLLEHSNWRALPLGISVVATSFGYHIIIPTLVRYLGHDRKALFWTLIWGGFIPLVLYLFWEYVCLGTLPLERIRFGFALGKDAVSLMEAPGKAVGIAGSLLLFFAIITSFLGVSLSLRDFLIDGTGIKKGVLGKGFIYFLTFMPPLALTLTDPRSFLNALEYAGAFGVVLLLVLLPVAMAWSGRYHKGYSSHRFKTPGGRAALIAAGLAACLILAIEAGNQLGYFSHLKQG